MERLAKILLVCCAVFLQQAVSIYFLRFDREWACRMAQPIFLHFPLYNCKRFHYNKSIECF